MSTDIERLLYSERQYLRSFDFTAEQTYHLEMRRRLSRVLHLWGIVKGLELLKGQIVQGAPDQFYVSEGMAIDAYGREIIVPAKHFLSDDLGSNRITGAGTYSIWIGYTREPTTPPEAGYQRCDLRTQFTRWRESFEILITAIATNPNPAEDPDAFGDLPDDPVKYPWWIHLGTINVDGSAAIAAATNIHRIYIGLRVQRIVAPRQAEAEYNILDANKPLHPLTSIGVRDNLFVEQNLIAGSDFVVDPKKIEPPPVTSPPATFPNSTGNIKIAGDVFLQGNLYCHCDLAHPDLWLTLDQCIGARIKSLVPEVFVGKVPVTFTALPSVDGSGGISATANVTITPTAQIVFDDSLNQITTSIAGVVGKSLQQPSDAAGRSAKAHIFASAAGGNPPFEILTSGSLSPNDGSTGPVGTYNALLTCTVGPAQQVGSTGTTPASFDVPVDTVFISYVIVLSPKQ
jgi:hypothetical protein